MALLMHRLGRLRDLFGSHGPSMGAFHASTNAPAAPQPPVAAPRQQLLGTLAMILCGATWILTGRCWWRGQWVAAVTTALIGYGVGALGGILLGIQ